MRVGIVQHMQISMSGWICWENLEVSELAGNGVECVKVGFELKIPFEQSTCQSSV